MTNWNLVHASDTAEELQELLQSHPRYPRKKIIAYVNEINAYLNRAIIKENNT